MKIEYKHEICGDEYPIIAERWYIIIDDELYHYHRTDGPVVIYRDRTLLWYLYDKVIGKSRFYAVSTSPHYKQHLRDWAKAALEYKGTEATSENIEVHLKKCLANVVDSEI